jgi:hypothetical protein
VIAYSQTLEVVLLVTMAVLMAGVLVWLIQALDALRLVTHGVGARHSRRVYWFAASLVITIVLFCIWFDPATLASDLDRYAISLRAQGMEVIPLTLTLGAVHLDPARPEYVIHTADLYTQLGREDRAAALRQDLAEKWRPYAMTVRQDVRWTADAGSVLQPMGSLTGGIRGEGAGKSVGETAGGFPVQTTVRTGGGTVDASMDSRHGPYLNVVPGRSEVPPH